MTTVPDDVDAGLHWIEPLHDGSFVRIRQLTPSDARREKAFLARLPSDQRRYRFVGLVKPIDDAVVRELTCVDPTYEVALGAFALAPTGADEIEIGAAHYCTDAEGVHCDCSVAVDPTWQKRGVGRALMRRLIAIARRNGIHRMYAMNGGGHAGAHSLAERLGFRSRPDPEDPLVTTFELLLDR
jgi:GNAT superfamily N-acetyltransferase